MIVAQNKLVSTFFNKEQKMLISDYKGRVKIDLALEQLTIVVDFYNSNQVELSLADLSKLHGSFARIINYLTEVYYPAAVKSGLKVQAFVVSKDLIIENLGFKLGELASSFNIKSRVFTDRKLAEAWVTSKTLNLHSTPD